MGSARGSRAACPKVHLNRPDERRTVSLAPACPPRALGAPPRKGYEQQLMTGTQRPLSEEGLFYSTVNRKGNLLRNNNLGWVILAALLSSLQ